MSLDKHISSAVKTCFHQLREFRHIRSFFLKSATIIFANAFIHFRIDYCNSLFYGLSKNSINSFQKIQNSVVCIVTRTSRLSHITLVLKSLHWLPVQYRINFKLCCISHPVLSLEEPHYLNSLLIYRLISHSLRSSFFNFLHYHFSIKNQMVFVYLLMLHHFFGTIYLTLLALHLLTYLFEEASKHISLIKHFPHRLSSLY